MDAGAQIGQHGALGVRRDQNQAIGRGRAVFGRGRIEMHAQGPDVVGEDAPEGIVLDLAGEGAFGAQARHHGDGVGGGPAGAFHGRAGLVIDRRGLGLVDQGHRTLGQALAFQEGVIGLGQNIDNGVADADNVETGIGHESLFQLIPPGRRRDRGGPEPGALVGRGV